MASVTGLHADVAPAVTVGQSGASQQFAAMIVPGKSESEVLDEAARQIEQDRPWYEALGLRWEKVGESDGIGSDVAVEAVLAFNVVNGLIDAANQTVLAPVFVIVKGLLAAVQGAAAARDEIVELVEYCVGISRCLLEAATASDMPPAIAATLDEFEGEIGRVKIFVQTYRTNTGCCWRTTLSATDRTAAATHQAKLKILLDAMLLELQTQAQLDRQKLMRMIADRDPPPLETLADVPRGAPHLPPTYVERLAVVERVVLDLIDPDRLPSAAHCLLGMGGVGKTILASSVVRDDRVRSVFKDGVFWVPVGRAGKSSLVLLLENLARDLAEAPAPEGAPPRNRSPHGLEGVDEAARYVSEVRERGGLRCLVVLDNAWDVEVVNAFGRTGFHLLVTTRQRQVVSPSLAGLFTEVGDMTRGEALEVLRLASRARGPLPDVEAGQVAVDCGMLPLALGMAGALAREQPLSQISWRNVQGDLREKRAKFREMEDGVLFSAIDASFGYLPKTQKRQFQLMAVMAPGTVATQEMLANLWDVNVSDVPTGTSILAGNSLLQSVAEGYRLHDLVLEYLELAIGIGGGDALANRASSRQARYLSQLNVLHEYSVGGMLGDGGLSSLVALWTAVAKIDKEMEAETYYAGSLKGATGADPWREAGQLLQLLGKYEGAETMLKKALEAAEQEGKDSEELATALTNLGNVLESQEKFEEAAPLYERAVEVGEQTLGPDHPSLARMLNDRAGVLRAQGKYREAGPIYLRAIGIGERTRGSDHPSLGTMLNNLAGLLKAQGALQEAGDLYIRAIEIGEKTLVRDHPDLATRLNNLAELYRAQGRFAKAEPLYERAQGIREKVLGDDHPAIATVLNNRVELLRMQGEYAQAQPLAERAQVIVAKSLGENHPNVAVTLTNRAGLLEAQGKFVEAGPLHVRAGNIWEQAHGPDHPLVATALNNQAALLSREGNLAEAEVLYMRSTAIWEKALGPDHADVGRSLNNLAALLMAQGRYEEADPLYLRAIEIGEKTLGPDHPSVATRLGNRARLLIAEGKCDEAIGLLERALAIRTEVLGEGHEDTLNYRRALLEAVRTDEVAAAE